MSPESIYQRAPVCVQTLLLNAYALGIQWHRFGAPYRAAVRQLLKTQLWPRQRIRAYQDERIRQIVSSAYDGSPYYRRVMDQAGVTPRDIHGVEDLARLPLLTSDFVRRRGEELLTSAKPLREWLHGHTSGTTGSPLSLWYDRNTCWFNNAVHRRQRIWAAMPADAWIGLLLGRVVVPTSQQRPPFWRLNRVHRDVWFSSFHMSEDNLRFYVSEIQRRKLQFLEGYPSTLFILAQYALRHGTQLPMRAVFTSSETLHSVQREAIEAAFGCRPYDFYGLAERVIFATECEHHDGKHLAEEYGYTELVDEHGRPVPDGQPGYLVGTSLHNEAMPLIRYLTSDISVIRCEPCECGRTLARIEDVATKAEDIVVTPEGRMISPSILTHPFKPFPQIIKSQIVQGRLDHLLVKLIPSDEFTPEHRKLLVEQLARRLGPRMEIEIRIVDEIPQEPSGKFRWVISRVDHSCHFSWERGT
jgi:phenylacetate-CoA ligase